MSERIDIHFEENGVARLVMRDREGRNTFTDDFIAEVTAGIEQVERSDPKVMILSGLPDVFCAGAERGNLIGLCNGEIHVKDLLISEALVRTSFPVIAAMEGHAIGGGFVMAMCCDMVLAARESRYGAVFMSLGFTPGMGCTTLLPELVGPFIANEMMFTAKRFKGRELAGKNTNINYILPRSEILPKAADLALQISEKNRESIHLLKNTLSARKRKLLIEARKQEDLMHRISFGFPETRSRIEEFYAGEKSREGKE